MASRTGVAASNATCLRNIVPPRVEVGLLTMNFHRIASIPMPPVTAPAWENVIVCRWRRNFGGGLGRRVGRVGGGSMCWVWGGSAGRMAGGRPRWSAGRLTGGRPCWLAGRRPCWSMCWRVRKHGRRSMASDNLTVSTNSTVAGVIPVTSLARSVMLMNRSRMGTVATMRTK